MICNVLEYLEKSAEKYPKKKVFSDPVHSISYRECTDICRRIGTSLAKMGRRNSPIAVIVDRNIESLELFLGIVYSGNFYVPVSKKLPAERITLILETMRPVCITGKEDDRMFAASLTDCVKFLSIENLADTQVDEDLLEEIRSQHMDVNPLYAIYTSGSSGIPKGVLISHRSVIDLAEQFAACFGFSDKDVFGNQAPFDFDVSVKDIYSTLKNSASMCIVTPHMITFPKKLIPYLNENKVTNLTWAVSALAVTAACKGLDKELPVYLKRIMFSGEVMPMKVLSYWHEKLPDIMYVNLYGPTEITCNCTYHVVSETDLLDEMLPIGKAFPNTEVFLLTENNTLAKEGETGEICVRGTCLALGYYKDEETTKGVFCRNPLNPDYPEKIYRTGDLGVYKNDKLYFAGRKDFQIKHMGHRIELLEIEACTDSLEYIERNCCIYDSDREKIYLFYQAQKECNRQIALDLQKALPKYMCPNRYIHIEKLPLNKNGKIDRQFLKTAYITGGSRF